MLEKLFDKGDTLRKDEITKSEWEFEKIRSRITTLQDQFMDDQIYPNDYNLMKQQVEKS